MLPGIFIILLFYAAGEFIGTLTGGLIPGSVIGMILLFAALCGKVVKPETVRPVARFLTDNMGLFFLPAGVGIVNAMDILSQSWQAVLTACAVSTVAVIVTVACTQEWLESRSRRRAAKTRTVSHPRKSTRYGHGSTRGRNQRHQTMNPLLHSEIFILTLVTGVYLAALWLYRKTRLSLLHPLLVSIPVLALGIRFLGIPFATFETGSRIINFLLGPTVVALGYLLYEQREHLKANGISILTSVFVGSVIGIVSVVLIARWMGADRTLIASLEPKSVTTPIAMSIAQRSGGIPAIAAVVVIVVGIFGGIVGPFILDRLGIRSRIARGLALGSAAHGLGTARAMELGAIEGAISGLAIGVMGIMTAILVPVIEWLLNL